MAQHTFIQTLEAYQADLDTKAAVTLVQKLENPWLHVTGQETHKKVLQKALQQDTTNQNSGNATSRKNP